MSKANLKGPFLYPSPSFVSLWQVVLSAIGAANSPACSIVQCSYSLLSLPDADTDHRRHHHRRPFTLIAFFAPPPQQTGVRQLGVCTYHFCSCSDIVVVVCTFALPSSAAS